MILASLYIRFNRLIYCQSNLIKYSEFLLKVTNTASFLKAAEIRWSFRKKNYKIRSQSFRKSAKFCVLGIF